MTVQADETGKIVSTYLNGLQDLELFGDTYDTVPDTKDNILGDWLMVMDPSDLSRTGLLTCGQILRTSNGVAEYFHTVTFQRDAQLGTLDAPVAKHCDCSLLLWPAPASLSLDVLFGDTKNVGDVETPLPVPAVDDSQRSTFQELEFCFSEEGPGCDTSGSYAAIDDIILVSPSATETPLSSVDFISFDPTTQLLTISPTPANPAGAYSLKGTYTTGTGVSVPVTIASPLNIICSIQTFNKPADPAPVTYYVNGDDKIIDMTNQWVQDPACGYVYTESFTWTGLTTYMTETSAGSGIITLSSTNRADEGTDSTLTINLSATVADNGDGNPETFDLTGPTNAVTI